MSGTLQVDESGITRVDEAGNPLVDPVSFSAPIDVTPPPVQSWTQAEIAGKIQENLPTGPVWPRDPDAVQTAICGVLAPTFMRLTDAAAALIDDIFPTTTGDLLPEWEAALGLPDPCAGTAPSTQARVAQVVARFVAGGGQSVPYFISFLATLGFNASVTEFTVARCGMVCNQPLYDEDWAFAWRVEVGTSAVTAGAVAACEIARLQPAHTNGVVTVNGLAIADGDFLGSEVLSTEISATNP